MAERTVLARQAAIWIEEGDRRAVTALTILKYAFPRDNVLDSLQRDVNLTVEGSPPEWLPTSLHDAILSNHPQLAPPTPHLEHN